MLGKFLKDKHGKVVVWQNPNLALWTWFVAMILTHILPYGQLNFAAGLISFGALFTWAWLEIFEGASYLRRTLGAIVLIWTVLSRLR